jgi:glutathione synthase/RimK-type ligase-like ATP-grasp enzyme
MSHLLGIYREALYSPGRHTSNDVIILNSIADALREMKLEVRLATLEQAKGCWQDAGLIFSMCQGPDGLQQLREWEKQGARIINQPEAAMNTYRDRLFGILSRAELPHPKSRLVATDAGVVSLDDFRGSPGVWVKRGRVHATQPGDVQFVESETELARVLREFRDRGIENAILQAPCEGDEIKFYAVRRGRFFWWFYPNEYEGLPFDEAEVRQLAERAALATGLEIFGGDMVIGRDGGISIIDLNDWPSFAPCRVLAPSVIAQHIKERFDAIDSREGRAPRIHTAL